MTTALWWIRRDLRPSDNQALANALDHADRVVPVYVVDRHPLASPESSEKRLAFLLGGLHRLDDDLRARGSRLIEEDYPAPLKAPFKPPAGAVRPEEAAQRVLAAYHDGHRGVLDL